MSEPTISIAEAQGQLREAVLRAARLVPRSKRAEFLAGLPAALEDAVAELEAGRRRSTLRALPPDGDEA